MSFNPDQIFSDFKILRKLGEGGMGEVYLAEDRRLDRQVALKILQSDFFKDKDKLDRFYREARTAAKISHPNVMSIHNIGSAKVADDDDEISYIVMEYVEGQSLKEYLAQGKASMADMLRIVEKIARGLAEAHKLNIVHRDIKADNIIIKPDGEPKILDFGLAKPLAAPMGGGEKEVDSTATVSQELTQEGKIIGTVTYMSPEQARGEKVDARSDIFSFGILMYKIFTGVFPFESSDRVSTIAKILEAPHEPLRRKEGTLPAELERIVDKCLQKDPNYRYQDTRDLAVDIRSLRRQYESGISDTESLIIDKPESTREKAGKFGSFKIPALIVGLLIVVGIYIGYEMMAGGGDSGPTTLHARQNAMAILGFENKTGDSELDWLQAGLPEILLTDLAQNGSSSLISRNRVLDCLDDGVDNLTDIQMHQECIEAAHSLGATKVLSGSFYKLGDKLRIDARLEDVETGEIILGEKVVGDDPFVLVDSLTQKIAVQLNIKEISSDNRNVASLTSSSPEAYKQYILGMEKYSLGQYDASLPFFKRAIEIDSSFALAYMRTGMVLFFKGQMTNSAPYLQKADQFSNQLPRKERELLDLYTDIFLHARFDDAFVKLKQFLDNYPEEKEPRAIHSILLYQMTQSPREAIAQLDTILMIDPQYLPALDNYITILTDQKDYDSAIAFARKMIEYYPKVHAGYITTANLYVKTGEVEKALEVGKRYLDIDPEHLDMLSIVANAHIRNGEFDKAEMYAEDIKKYHGDDPFKMMDYYRLMRNILNWQGDFMQTLELYHKNIENSLQTSDSSSIFNAYLGMASFFISMEMPDSAMYYSERMLPYAVRFQHFNYPLIVISTDYARKEEAKEYFDVSMEHFKASIPAEVWHIGEAIEKVFIGYYEADTLKTITAYEDLAAKPLTGNTSNIFEAGKLAVITGLYQRGIDNLLSVTEGTEQTISAVTYIESMYYLGRAYEALAETRKAVDAYSEVVRYWGDADFQLELIKDSKARLARMQS